jgi:hypothetical protein
MGVAVALEQRDGTVPPGSEASREIRIRNTGAIVDQFELDVVGEAASWTRVEPSQVNLMPGEEGSATLVFAPPRSSHVAAGPVPFALRVMSREDTGGSSVEEMTVTVGSFSQVAADLVPRTSYGRFGGRHELALDNLGNHPELVAVTATDPDRLLNLRVDPANVTVEAGTATFVKIKAKPKKTFWLGPNKTIPFHVVVTGAESEQTMVQGSLLQQPILPPWFFKAVLAAVAVAIALAFLWFAFLKPAVESTAKSVAEDHTEDLVAAVDEGNKQAAAAAAAAEEAAKTAGEADSKSDAATKGVDQIRKDVDGGSTSGQPSGGTLSTASATDFRITTEVPPAGGFLPSIQDVPDGKIIWISDIVLQNPAGDSGKLRIQRGDQVLFEFGLENFRDLDYHLIQPIQFTDANDVVVAVDCKNTTDDCTPSVYFTGRITDVPKKKTG